MRRRRKKWTAPNNPTPQAKAVWAAMFPREDWPTGWKVQWVGFMRGALGLTIYSERRILLSWGDATSRKAGEGKDVVGTLLHEFVHVRAGHTLRHGKEFRALENNYRARLGLDSIPEPTPGPPRHRHRYTMEEPLASTAGWYVYTCGECSYRWNGRRPGLIKHPRQSTVT